MKEKQMNNVWLKTDEEKLRSLISDEARNKPILEDMLNSTRQLLAKQTFRLALLNQLLDELIASESKKTLNSIQSFNKRN